MPFPDKMCLTSKGWTTKLMIYTKKNKNIPYLLCLATFLRSIRLTCVPTNVRIERRGGVSGAN